jgi:hypothetical protein
MSILEIISGAKLVGDTLKAVTGILKDGKELLPPSDKKIAIENKLADAERALHLSDIQISQIASDVGYRLCLAHWPPKIMVKTGEDEATLEAIFTCSDCGVQDPSRARLDRMASNNRVYVAKVKRGWEFFEDT